MFLNLVVNAVYAYVVPNVYIYFIPQVENLSYEFMILGLGCGVVEGIAEILEFQRKEQNKRSLAGIVSILLLIGLLCLYT